MSAEKEIQISAEQESEILKDFYAAMMSGSYHALYANAKTLGKQHERLVEAFLILQNAFLDFHEIKNKAEHRLLLSQGCVKIIDISDEPSLDIQ